MHVLCYRPLLRPLLFTRTHRLVLQRVYYSVDENELLAARAWLAKLDAETIPFKSIGELSFSRSSGPGGQNVNKYDDHLQFLIIAKY